MDFRRFSFGSTPWTPGQHPKERKKAEGVVGVLQFDAGFEDPNWCVRAHVVYVIAGQLEVLLDDRTERLVSGDACCLGAGTRHRVRNPGEEAVTLFIISDIDVAICGR